MSSTTPHTRKPGRPPASVLDMPTADKILREASFAFLQSGFEGVSLETVAKSCNVTKATVYYYFSSKADLFTKAMLRMMEQARKSTLAILEMELPLQERLYKIAAARLRIDVRMEFDRILRGGGSELSDAQRAEMKLAEKELERTLAHAFAVAIQQGEVRALDPYWTARAFTALLAVENTEEDTPDSRAALAEERAHKLIAFFWNGIHGGESAFYDTF